MLELAVCVAIAASLVAAHLWSEGRLDLSVYRWFDVELEEASRGQDIRFTPRSPWSRTAIGTCDDLSVRVELGRATPTRLETYRPRLCVTISGPRIAPGLAFARERGTGDDVLTGDTVFDDAVEVRGEPRILLALLKRELRIGGLEDATIVGPGVQRGGGRGIDGQGLDVQVRQTRVGGGPGAAGVGGLEDPATVGPGVERGGSRGIDGQRPDPSAIRPGARPDADGTRVHGRGHRGCGLIARSGLGPRSVDT